MEIFRHKCVKLQYVKYVVIAAIAVQLFLLIPFLGDWKKLGSSSLSATNAELQPANDRKLANLSLLDCTERFDTIDEKVLSIDKAIEPGREYFSIQVTEGDIEDLSVKLPRLLPNYKNPCWVEFVPQNFSYGRNAVFHVKYRREIRKESWRYAVNKMETLLQTRRMCSLDGRAWRMRCFPYFFIPGFTKGGTSDLYQMLKRFPDIIEGPVKEPKYWNFARYSQIGAKFSDYLDLFDEASEQIRNKVIVGADGRHYHPGIIGDFDPMVMWKMQTSHLIKGNESRNEPKCLIPQHLRSISASIKFIVLMRNPADRTYSHYKHFIGGKNHAITPAQFHKDIIRALDLVKGCTSKACIYGSWGVETSIARALIGGFYHVFIEDWLSVFPIEQFLFIRSEDYFRNRSATLMEILNFLQIDIQSNRRIIEEAASLPAIHATPNYVMTQETRALLERFFRPKNEKLRDLLNDDKWLWHI